MLNKKGMATIGLFLIVFIGLFAIIMIGVLLFIFNTVTESLSIDILVGQVNLKNATEDTLGKMNTGFIQSADYIGLAILLGMALFMIMNAFFFGQKNIKLFLVIDIFILIFAFILSVYIAQSFSYIVNASDQITVFINDMPKSSGLVLNMPIYITTIGILILIFSYSLIPKNQNILGEREEVAVYGYG
jgi:hypothetical protein